MQLTSLSLLLGGILAAAHAQTCLTDNDNRPPSPDGKKSLYTGQQEFSLALLNAINQLNPEGNLFFSPYSTYHALLLAYFISGDKTEMFLRKSLRLDPKHDKADVYSAYKLDKLQQQLAGNLSYEFTNANRLYVSNQVNVRDCIHSRFPNELQQVDFVSQPDAVRTSINRWVENATHDMIRDLLPPGSLDATTSLVLVNAAYFKGVWENKFNPDDTKQEVFHISPEKRTFVDMMHVDGTFNHDVSESLKAHILELPYKGEDISMFILLPPFLQEDGIANILKSLTLEKFRSIVEEGATLVPKTVKVGLPKFSLEHTLEMVPILEHLGVGNLFRSGSDFSRLALPPSGGVDGVPGRRPAVVPVQAGGARASALANGRGLTLGAGVHKAKITVDEQGAQAAAATAFFSFRIMSDLDDSEDPVEFVCNRSFVFLNYNRRQKTVLFVGIYRGDV